MPIIPHSISADEFPTFGEKKLHRIFSDLYGDSDDVYVWYEPPALNPDKTRNPNKKYFTDFIIFNQGFGILNLEVKDWKLDKIRKASKLGWEIETGDGRVEKKECPLEQSRRCAYGMKDNLVEEKDLTHTTGEHKGKLLFPFGFGVVFTHISRVDTFGIDGFSALIPGHQALYKDDLDFDVADKEARLMFEKKLRGLFTQWFEFEPLTFSHIKLLRKAIWPELIVKPIQQPLFTVDPTDWKLLDLQQEDFAKSLGEGHHLIKGVAGSGKTLILAYRARYLHKLRKDWNILFVCYNKSLKNYVRKILASLIDNEDFRKIDIFHFHELVSKKTGMSAARLQGETDQDWDSRLGTNLLISAKNNMIHGHKYDAIMIDEAQDFSTEWLKGIRHMLGKTDIITIALDPAQDIYGRHRVWKEAGIEIVGGRRSRKLRQSYRNTNEIFRLAIMFQGLENYIEPDDDDPDSILLPKEVERHGEKAVIQQLNSQAEEFERIASDIQALVQSKKYSYKDICVIMCLPQPSKELLKTFESKKIPSRSLISTTERDMFDLDEETVKVITIESSKGLEWKVVFLVGIDSMPRKGRELKHENNLVYIAITRAQECFFCYYTQSTSIVNKLSETNKKILN